MRFHVPCFLALVPYLEIWEAGRSVPLAASLFAFSSCSLLAHLRACTNESLGSHSSISYGPPHSSNLAIKPERVGVDMLFVTDVLTSTSPSQAAMCRNFDF